MYTDTSYSRRLTVQAVTEQTVVATVLGSCECE